MAAGSWGESRRMAPVGWWQGREAGPLGMKVVAAESVGLVFTVWAGQRHINGNFQKIGLRSEAGKNQRYFI